jgi:hypothetical protein
MVCLCEVRVKRVVWEGVAWESVGVGESGRESGERERRVGWVFRVVLTNFFRNMYVKNYCTNYPFVFKQIAICKYATKLTH